MSYQSEKIKPKIHNQPQQKSFPPQQKRRQMSKSASLIQRELRQIIAKMYPKQRQAMAEQFMKNLGEQGIEAQSLARTLTIRETDPAAMNSEEISQVATYTYEHYPEVFEAVLTQPNVVQFLSQPVLSAIVGIMAAKWLNP
ncbi:MAG: hypothetical protein GVY17_11015 [Cyanobacteria bacterium]|jgi:uncharacterized protein YqfB (UPF0267 family)|nr:hypothetical protein [Cyanobacteria bacterium GSL.Bin21]